MTLELHCIVLFIIHRLLLNLTKLGMTCQRNIILVIILWLNGLYEERYRWVPCFVKTICWARMSTIQRSESINAFFDGYVNSKTTLKQFVEKYKKAMESKIEKEW